MPAVTPPKIIGPAFPAAGLDQTKDEIEVTALGTNVIRTVRKLYSAWKTGLPAIYSPHPTETRSYLQTIRCVQHPDGADLCDVVFRYEPDAAHGAVPDTVPVPDDDVAESGSAIDIDITRHPAFTQTPIGAADDWPDAPWSDFWDYDKNRFKPASEGTPDYLVNLTKYKLGAGQVAITKYYRQKPTEDRFSKYGKISNPGHNLGGDGHWMILTGGLNKRGGFWALTYVYQYSETEYPDEVYGDIVDSLA